MIVASVLTVVEHCCVGMHVFHILIQFCPISRFTSCDISRGTPCIVEAGNTSMLTCLGFGDPIPSVMGNHLNIHVRNNC